jgi:hypothetical protein
VKKAVSGISNPTIKGMIADTCARTLKNKGQNQAAIEVAQLIPDARARDALLASLATKR